MAGPRAASGLPWDVACAAESYAGACAYGTGARERHSPLLPKLLSWEDSISKAEATLKLMSQEQKTSLLQGTGWEPTKWWFDLPKYFYVGNTPAMPEIGLPSLNMQDATDGFRTYWTELSGTITVWPSILAMAATWDPIAVQDFAVAVGQEFREKGANVILGPGVQVQRVARCGRSFEYFSGDDPYLGSELTRAYVKGVQSQGVLGIVKHWVFNSQETRKGEENSVVDNKTAHELYFPPFVAAIEAGVGGAMCSYNKVDGQYSCSNSYILNDVLKGELGFQGFVQSDWWAVHEPSFVQGLDQEMPGQATELFLSPSNTSQHPQRVDEAATRILAAMYKVNLHETSSCSPPNCSEWFVRNVTTSSHKALTKSLATDSIVLLKNEESLLPISKSVKRIAIIGSVADSESYDPAGATQGLGLQWWSGDYYSGGGSGHLTGNVTSALQGLSARAALEGIEVIASASDNLTAAEEAARQADLAIVVVGATSGESVDRPNLTLDRQGDDLVAAVAAISGTKTIVLMQICGAVLMPWRGSVGSILSLFLGGEATGQSWAAVLFGDVSPSGRLPLMMPETEADSIPPSSEDNVVYSEGLATSYRNTSWKAAYPFGHGLSYSQFRYSTPKVVECPYKHFTSSPVLCIKSTVENIGSRPSRTVPQLYLEFPPEAEQPVAILKGFQKTAILQPQDSADVVFPLTERDLSFWKGGWKRVNRATAHLALSSANFLDSGLIELPEQTTTTVSSPPLSLSHSWKAALLPLFGAYVLAL